MSLHRDEPAGPHDSDAIGDPLDLGEHVGRQQHAAATRGVLTQNRMKLGLDKRVKAAGGLI